MYKSEESGLFEYATAKIMKLMLAKELNKRLKASLPEHPVPLAPSF